MSDSATAEAHNPIAIVGIGCRYPGASNAEELWQNLLAGKDSIGPYPSGRFPGVDRSYESSRERPGRLLSDAGGFLPNVDAFDAQFFEISPRESIYIDPQHRLLLEVAWEALENGGQVRQRYQCSQTGVFIGLWTSEYESRLYESASEPDFYSITGCGRASASGRLSFTFGFEGPSVTVDSACSSSLVAVHLACQSLWSGECEMALAGGANVILGQEIPELFTKAGMLSRDGRCKFGDAVADGFVRSEGAGIVVLKRLSRARTDRDRVYAVIRGGATNNDGRTSGLLITPSRPAQRQMMLRAWKTARIDPAQLRYIEAHGTGTGVGDPVEISAIADALSESGVSRPCSIGSIKSNFGHTESASGVAGLIKTALVLHHRMIPPSLHCRTPNPKIAWDEAPVRVATECLDLRGEPGPLLAGVSSFGITGTNAHLVLEEAEPQRIVPAASDRPLVFTVSARTREALRDLREACLNSVQRGSETRSLHDLCYTASVRRTHHEYRTAIVCTDFVELEERLAAAIEDEPIEGLVSGRALSEKKRVVFVAPGQGSQWLGMARELYEADTAFRNLFEECDRAIRAETGWSLMDRLLGEQAEEYLSQIDVIQPALFTMSVALAAVWRAWGVEPDAVVGHSMGEVAAAHLAGVLSLPDAVAVICRRSRLMKTLRSSGGMATVDLPLREAETLLVGTPELSVAASNGPRTTVISGDLKALEAFLRKLTAKEIYCRLVKVDVASHSAQVDPILEQLSTALSDICPQPAMIPMLSTVSGEFAFQQDENGTRMDAAYWVRNLRRCVLLAPAIRRLCESGHNTFIELSPHPILLPSIEAAARDICPDVTVVASLRREKPAAATMLSGLAAMYAAGYPVEWERLYPDGGQCISLPQYPFQRERCWPEPATTKQTDDIHDAANPLLGRRFTSSRQPKTTLWESRISLAAIPYLNDHRVLRSAVFPASAYVEMAVSAIGAMCPGQSFELTHAAFLNAAYLPDEGSRILQLAITPDSAAAYSFEIRGRAEEDETWTLHATGRLSLRKHDVETASVSLAENFATCPTVRDAKYHYETLASSGLGYGPAFQAVEEVWVGNGQAICRVRANLRDQERYGIHPAILDASFQAMTHVRPEGFSAEHTFLPISIDRVSIYRAIQQHVEIFAQARLAGSDRQTGTFRVDLRLLDADGSCYADISGMEVRRVAREDSEDRSDCLYTVQWVPEDIAVEDRDLPKVFGQTWVVFADARGIGGTLRESLEFGRGRCITVRPGQVFSRISDTEYTVRTDSRADLDRLFVEIAAPGAPAAVIHLWSLNQSEQEYDASVLIGSQAVGSQHVPLLVQSLTACNWPKPPRLWLVTAGAFAIGEQSLPRIESAPMWGVGRTVAREHPELRTVLVDLSAGADTMEARELARHISSSRNEDRIALRGGKAYVARLSRLAEAAAEESRPLGSGEAYGITIQKPGILDHLQLRALPPRLIASDEVEIAVTSAGLNFIDVAKTMGIYPGLDPGRAVGLGLECAGRVVSVGDQVHDSAPGDEVIAIATSSHHSLLASRVIVPAQFVIKKPSLLSLDEAATTPIAFLTAYYSLMEIVRMQRGDWVLVHAAAGGVGIAAIQIAQWAGATVIATVGSKEKEEFVRSLGVAHVFHSRSLDFAAAVMDVTGGRGVDVVLNSLTGEFIDCGLKVLAPYGRFVELGKRDIYEDRQIGMFLFRKNISFYAVDLAAALEERPQYVLSLLDRVMHHLSNGDWRPLPVITFSSAEPSEPFRYMAQARHIGKIAVRMDRDVQVLPISGMPLFSRNASYLITGGLGGIALRVAEWMASNGAGNLALVSRRAVNEEAMQVIRRIEAAGASVQSIRADVTRESDLDRVLSEIRSSGRALRGIMHTAAVVDDALTVDLTPERFVPVMAPKIEGTWRLHLATLSENLDFFVLFSSIAAIHPQPGMGSYAAANAFLDSFAHYRRALHLPATSVNWGGWDQIGLAREAGTERSIQGYVLQGMPNLSGDEALQALGRTIRCNPAQAVAVTFEWKKFAEFHGAGQAPPLFSDFVSGIATANSGKSNASEILSLVTNAESAEGRSELFEAYLQETLGQVLKLSKSKIDRDRALGTMGLDSLLGLEFVRRLSGALQIAVPATVVFNYPTIRVLARHLLQRMQLQPSETAAALNDGGGISRKAPALVLPADVSEEDALQALIGGKGNA